MKSRDSDNIARSGSVAGVHSLCLMTTVANTEFSGCVTRELLFALGVTRELLFFEGPEGV